ncbi:MAG: hypothetical protein FGO69_08640 [Methanobacterium sp.]|jgi:hypothetical protein|nr:MAG: hypothetical protein FGO69_08640 [Methanobacterium sp.]
MNVKREAREAIRLPLNEYGTYRKKKISDGLKLQYPLIKQQLTALILLTPELNLTKPEKELVIAFGDLLDNIRDRMEFTGGIP